MADPKLRRPPGPGLRLTLAACAVGVLVGALVNGNQSCMHQTGAPAPAAEAAGSPVLLANSPPDNLGYPRAYAVPGASSNIANLTAFASSLWDLYQQRLHSDAASNSTIVYTCSQDDLCGGWGDRLRGIVTLFYYALLTDSQFDIVNTKPLDLATVYPLIAERRPAYTQEDAHDNSWVDTKMDFLTSGNLRADVQQHRVHRLRSNGYPWYNTRRNIQLADVSAFYKLDRVTSLDLFRIVIELYFSRLSPELQALVDAELEKMTVDGKTPYRVGVQIRQGGSWGDATRHPTESAIQFAEQTLEDCKQAGFGKNCSIYVTSDSEPAQELLLKHIREQQPTIHASSATGAPVHVDKSSIAAEDRSALLKSYVDWEVLRRMDRLAVSRSGYGETAAWTAAVPATCMSTDDHKLFPFDTIIGPYVGW